MDAASLDRVGPWRFEDLAGLPGDGRRYEVVDGLLVVSPPPSQVHQLLSARLARQLQAQARDGWEVVTEFALPLGTDGRVPDVAVVQLPPLGVAAGPYPYGPDCFGLVIEVVSPSSRKTDRFAKPGEYAEAGIRLFWRVETEPEVAVLAFQLDESGAGYLPVGQVARERGRLPAPWGPAEVDVDALLGHR